MRRSAHAHAMMWVIIVLGCIVAGAEARAVDSASSSSSSNADLQTTRPFVPLTSARDISSSSSDSDIDDIITAPPDILQASLRAADLAAAAYADAFLPSAEASAINTDPAVDQKFKLELTQHLARQGSVTVGFVDRAVLKFGAVRYLHAFVAATAAAEDGGSGVIDVVFRGTDGSTYSVGTDLESKQIPLPGAPGAMVHEGFYLSLTEKPGLMYNKLQLKTSAYDDIRGLITTAQAMPGIGRGARINLIGHSLGAAEAALCAYLLRTADDLINIRLITFGQPQTGNQGWHDAFNAALGGKHMRWWNMQDHVSQVPNSKIDPGIIFGSQSWFTTDTLYRIDSVAGQLKCGIPTGVYSICDDRPASCSPANQQSCFVDVSILTALDSADHKIGSYREHLAACLTAGNISTHSSSVSSNSRFSVV